MNSFTVCVSKMEYLNALEVFSGEVVIGNTLVNIREGSHPTTIINSRLVKHYDLLLDPSISMDNRDAGGVFGDVVVLPRHSKVYQSVLLKEYLETFTGIKHYYEIPSYSYGGKIPHYLPPGPYIIKPGFGARGLGIMKFHTEEISPYKVSRVLNSLSGKALAGSTIDAKSELAKVNITLMDSEENSEGESVSKLWMDDKVVQQDISYMTDIKEVRVLMCNGVKPIYYAREDLLNESVTYSTKFEPSSKIEETLFKEIQKVIEGDFPQMYGSVDVWFSTEHKKWGIFEFQPQYDYSNICQEEHYEFMKDVMKKFIKMTKPDLVLW